MQRELFARKNHQQPSGDRGIPNSISGQHRWTYICFPHHKIIDLDLTVEASIIRIAHICNGFCLYNLSFYDIHCLSMQPVPILTFIK